ncbi:MAG: hypothetical protein BYD32DRAFT_428261, partial [Podila humilis]
MSATKQDKTRPLSHKQHRHLQLLLFVTFISFVDRLSRLPGHLTKKKKRHFCGCLSYLLPF